MEKIIITHGDIKENYDIIGPKWFEIRVANKSCQQKQQQWFFEKAIKQLEKECKSIECNAIIHLRHQIINSSSDVYTYEFYGTAVNIVK